MRGRTSLAPRREEIESWVREGATDEWIAQALGTTANSVQSFRSRSGILREGRGRSDRRRDNQEIGKVSAPTTAYEGVLEHGEEDGYGLWLDPSIADDPAFKKGFAGVEDVEVCIQRDRIVLRPLEAGDQASAGPADARRFENLEGIEEFQPGLSGFEAALGSLPASNRERGEIKFFEPEKGFGFIKRPQDAGSGELFFHKSQVSGRVNASTLSSGIEVSYEVGSNHRGLVAEDVRSAD